MFAISTVQGTVGVRHKHCARYRLCSIVCCQVTAFNLNTFHNALYTSSHFNAILRIRVCVIQHSLQLGGFNYSCNGS